MEIIPTTAVCALGDHLSSDLGAETVILHMGEGVYFGLDEVGTAIWKLIRTVLPHRRPSFPAETSSASTFVP